MLHIAKRINKNRACFPSIRLMCKDTGFGKAKIFQLRNSLREKGFIDWAQRYKNGRLSSCVYTVKTNFISIFVGLGDTGELSENDEDESTDYKLIKKQTTEKQCTEKQYTEKQNTENQYKKEVLTNSFEVLTNKEVLISKEESVVTDTPPLQTFENSDFSTSEKPNNSENEKRNDIIWGNKKVSDEKRNNPTFYGRPENETSALNSEKEKKEKEKVAPKEKESAKPKKPVREWFKLSSLTEEQKDKIRKLSREFDSPAVFGDSLRQWLEYKESNQVNFNYQKINPYKDFETMLKQVSIEAKKCQGQSQAFKLAVEYSIENLYLGLFPEKFITQTQPVKNGNYNKQQQGSVQPTIIFKTGC